MSQAQQARDFVRTRGLPPGADLPLLAVQARALYRVLSDRANRRRAGDAAEAAHRGFALSTRSHPPGPGIACRAGCAFCCHTLIVVTAPEAFRLARHVRGDAAADRQRIAAAAAATRGVPADQRARDRRPCALLLDGRCTAYDARPLLCRAGNSLDAAACEAGFGDPGIVIPASAIPLRLKDAHMLALVAALRAAALDARAYELNHALTVALPSADAEQRWLSGEDVFAGVQQGPPPPPPHAALLERLAAEAAR